MLLWRVMSNTTTHKTKLLAEKATLEEELGSIALFNTETNMWEATPDQDMMGEIDDNDAADRFEDFESRSGMVSTLQARLTNVEKALENIEAGTYGTCEICEKKIEPDRLDAVPSAKTCKAHMND
jgi:DnaK suppressor protein